MLRILFDPDLDDNLERRLVSLGIKDGSVLTVTLDDATETNKYFVIKLFIREGSLTLFLIDLIGITRKKYSCCCIKRTRTL